MKKTLVLSIGLLLASVGAFAQTSFNLEVPYVAPGSISIDGLLNEPEWVAAGTLIFGCTGIPAGYDNEFAYSAGSNLDYYHEPEQIFRFLHDGTGKIYVSMESNDTSIQTNTGGDAWFYKTQSDGLGQMAVEVKDSSPKAHGIVTLTFYPDDGANTVITPSQGYFLGADRGDRWDWSFQPGNNSVNDPSDTDTGYIIEFELSIADFSYAATDTDIVIGIQTNDKNGLPLDEWWPWSNSFAHVFQWSDGPYVPDFAINHLLLQPPTDVEYWDQY